MSPEIATLIFTLGILGLFFLDRNPELRTSPALWIPTLWFMISSSRPVVLWVIDGVGREVSDDPYRDGNMFDAAILSCLIATGLIVLAVRGRQTSTFLRLNGPIVALVLYAAISVCWSDYPFVAFKRWVQYLGSVVMIMIVLTDPDPSAAIRRLITRCGYVLIPISLLLIKYFPQYGSGYNQFTGEASYHGVTTGKNALGWVCLIFGLGFLWHVFEALRTRERFHITKPLIAHGVIVGMTLWMLYLAHSSAAVACFLIGSGLMVLMTWRLFVFTPMARHILLWGIVILCFYGLVIDTSIGLVNAAGRDTTLTGRSELWHDLLNLSVDQWGGTGFESFWLGERENFLREKYWWHPNQAHNGYLEVFINLGWAGIALLGMVIVWGYRNINDFLGKDPELGRLKLAFFTVVLIFNLTEAGFRTLNPLWIVFLLVIAVVPASTEGANK